MKTRKSGRNEFGNQQHTWKKSLDLAIAMAALLSLTIASSLVLGIPFLLSSADAKKLTCDGLDATIIGKDKKDDVLQGTAGDDVIVGLGGNDQIFGNGGSDHICGGDGDDKIYGGNNVD